MLMKVLIDNISKDDLVGEWGLSIYVEYKNKKYLLDTGTSGVFVENAEKMKVNLSKIDYGILSHAHYDHADGLKSFFEINHKAKFYMRKECEENCYSIKDNEEKYIGIHKGYLEKFKNRIEYVDNDYEINEGVYLIGHKTENLEEKGKTSFMYQKKGDKWQFDNFNHEQSLVFDTKKGLVIFNSCCHAGADTIVKEIERTFPNKKIHAIIGGFHLKDSTEEQMKDFALRMKEANVDKMITGHCTGEEGYKILKEYLGDKILQMYTGMEVEF